MKNNIILDGGMGTMLQAAGLGLGERPDVFGMKHPDVVECIQRSYVEAGSRILYANTFGTNAHKLEGTGYTVEEVISANIAIARKAAGGKAKVALDVGPIGELLEPLGMLSFEKAYDIYAQVVKAGAASGADLIIFETMTDLYEVKAAVLAAKENSTLPIWTTMSFEASGRTFTGTTVASMALTLTGLSVDALGINCSLGPKELVPLVKELRQWTDLPIIVKPNAGLPDPATGEYSMGPEEFGQCMAEFPKLGASIFGGCCGTNPDFIRALAKLPEREDFVGTAVQEAENDITEVCRKADCPSGQNTEYTGKRNLRRGVCSAGQVAEFGGLQDSPRVLVVGERINPTGKKRFAQALRDGDMNYIMERAIEQADAGADILDINVGLPGIEEAEMMTRVVKAVQSVVSLPLQIDSSDPAAIEAGLRACNGRAIVNSVNGEPEVLEKILPIVKKYGAAVVGLTMDKGGIPETAEERIDIAKRILDAALNYGIPKEDVLIDALTLTISAQQKQAAETLKAVRHIHEKMGLHCVLGVSNISFGLPERSHITASFLTQAMCCGLDFPIINPNQKEIMDMIFSYRALSGEDVDCAAYIERFAGETSEKVTTVSVAEMTLETAVLKGLKQEVANLTEKYLETMSELDVINQKLIPALDVVGERYEKQQIFLPQLINAANAACAGFDLIKARIAGRGGESLSKGKIILATVEGDIHDIGKNIVRVVLENYGYQVIDLGRDVPVQTVVEAVLKEKVSLVGLSALMTTTVSSMQKTIAALRESGHPCKIFVGGAVLTKQYAMEIGADFYAKDAKASADIAKEVLG
ncbi:MAG: dihydropteroate synthase [Lachnospiraceae bacterium]|nr:dihydropteroate synthase [Lachnospiraceae bacterium]